MQYKIPRPRSCINTKSNNSQTNELVIRNFPGFCGSIIGRSLFGFGCLWKHDKRNACGFTVGLSFLSTICTLTKSVFRFSEKEIEHHNSSSNFGDIASDIELYLAKRVHHNGSLKSFLDMTHELILVHESTAPPIPDEHMKQSTAIYKPPPSGRSPIFNKIEIATIP